MTSSNGNKLFYVLYCLMVLACFVVIYRLGFGVAAGQISTQPERLRDITFPIWDSYPLSQHGFLVFLSPEQFQERVAYSNHSTAYLFYMYLLYKVEMIFPALQMRVTAAFLNMLSLAGVVLFITSRLLEERLGPAKALLALFAVVFMITMPAFWISAARMNVDNSFPMMFSISALAAFFIWRNPYDGRRITFILLLLAIIAPMSAALLGAALFVFSIQRDGVNLRLMKVSGMAAAFGAAFYLQAPLVSKLLGFSSSNSSWMFRSGLDGDTTYFTIIFESIFSPYFPRPVHIIAVPLLVLLVQTTWMKFRRANMQARQVAEAAASSSVDSSLFYYLLFSQYVLTCLLWPQAVSIHPYLYDYLLIAPASMLIVLNFIRQPTPSSPYVWLLALLFCISFNLQQIAQAKCTGCIYPKWGITRN